MGLGPLDERARGDCDGKSRLEGRTRTGHHERRNYGVAAGACGVPPARGHDQRKYPYGFSDHCAGNLRNQECFRHRGRRRPRIETRDDQWWNRTEKIRRLTKRSAEDARRGREEKTFVAVVVEFGQVEEPERRLCGEREGTAPPQV